MPTELQTFPFDWNKDTGEQLACAYRDKQYISEEACKEICWESDHEITRGESRWYKNVTALFEYEGKYYGLSYDRGLTECQENEYWKQIPKLYKKIQVIRYTYKEVKEETTDGKTTEELG